MLPPKYEIEQAVVIGPVFREAGWYIALAATVSAQALLCHDLQMFDFPKKIHKFRPPTGSAEGVLWEGGDLRGAGPMTLKYMIFLSKYIHLGCP